MLWGSHARKKKVLIDSSRHLILESTHPSPLSAHRVNTMLCLCFGVRMHVRKKFLLIVQGI
ncbi:hypothetical protein IBE76_10310 [Francisella tularensis]|nr:hypothetical protein [Francisella tularensis]